MSDLTINEGNEPEIMSDEDIAKCKALADRWRDECTVCNHSGYLEGGKDCICTKKSKRKYRLMCSNIPKHYYGVSFDDFRAKNDVGFKKVLSYVENLDNARKKGIGLHLYSKTPGTGKTLLGICVLLAAIKKGHSVWFTSLEQLSEDIKAGFTDHKKAALMNWVMFSTKFLMLDEISKVQNTAWKDSRVNDLIQRRVNDGLSIISTDNLGIDQLSTKFPEHLVSRFAGTQIEISLSSKLDFRKEVKRKNLEKLLKEK